MTDDDRRASPRLKNQNRAVQVIDTGQWELWEDWDVDGQGRGTNPDKNFPRARAVYLVSGVVLVLQLFPFTPSTVAMRPGPDNTQPKHFIVNSAARNTRFLF